MRYGLATANDYVNTASPCRISKPSWQQRVKFLYSFQSCVGDAITVDFQPHC